MEPADRCIKYRVGGAKLFYHFGMFRRRVPREKRGPVYCFDFLPAYASGSIVSKNDAVCKCG